jgi:sterol desaturase/sphingolipid hydroxylase (fatty acid hydroxylase superfamily)
MAAIAHPHARPLRAGPRRTPRDARSAQLWVLSILYVVIGAVLVSIMMVLSVVLTHPAPGYDGHPWPQPVPQPTVAEAGLDL